MDWLAKKKKIKQNKAWSTTKKQQQQQQQKRIIWYFGKLVVWDYSRIAKRVRIAFTLWQLAMIKSYPSTKNYNSLLSKALKKSFNELLSKYWSWVLFKILNQSLLNYISWVLYS